MLKGVCEIELRDENENVVQKTKDYNMITDALNRILNPDIKMIKRIMATPSPELTEYYNSKLPILDRLIGGVLLFSEVQEESVDNIMYDVTTVVGSGSVMTEVMSNDNRIGLLNKEESTVIRSENDTIKGMRLVWDFATNQANGTIRSVSLTTGIAAKGLYQNDAIAVHLKEGLNNLYPLSYLKGQNVVENHTGGIYNGHTYAYLMQIKEDEFIVVTKAEIKRVKVKNNIGLTEVYNNILPVGSETIVSVANDDYLSSLTETEIAAFFTIHNNELYYCKTEGKILTVTKYDSVTLEATTKNIDLSQNLNAKKRIPATIYNNYYVVMDASTTSSESANIIKFFNIEDLTLAKSLNSPVYTDIWRDQRCSFTTYLGYLIVASNSSGSRSVSYDSQNILIIDKNLNVVSSVNNSSILRAVMPVPNCFVKDPFLMCRGVVLWQYSSNWNQRPYYSIAINPNIKFTIDNLATPVTKTASQTMKVIYTIQDAPEE